MAHNSDIVRHRWFTGRLTLYLLWVFLIPSVCLAVPYKIIHVIDDITIKAARPTGDLEIRLVGIKSPMSSKDPAQAPIHPPVNSRLFLARMVLNKTVDVRSYGYNIYNQMLAIIYADGKNVNLELIKTGRALVQRDKAPPNLDLTPYRDAETAARQAGIGLWATGGPDPPQDRQDMDDRGQEKKVTVYEFAGQDTPPEPGAIKTTVVKRIDFRLDDIKETIFVYIEDFAIAKAFDLSGKNARIVIDILNISSWKGKRVIPVNGKWIRRVRTHLHKDVNKMRIVLDLRIDASKDYSITQFYDMKEHIYQLEISPVH